MRRHGDSAAEPDQDKKRWNFTGSGKTMRIGGDTLEILFDRDRRRLGDDSE